VKEEKEEEVSSRRDEEKDDETLSLTHSLAKLTRPLMTPENETHLSLHYKFHFSLVETLKTLEIE